MIIRNSDQTKLEFGTGDICVNGGHCGDLGVVAFSNQAPREINSEGDIKAGNNYNLDDFPVVMTFTKPESIDVVIGQLEQAAKDMGFNCEKEKLKQQKDIYKEHWIKLLDQMLNEFDKDGWCRLVMKKDEVLQMKKEMEADYGIYD